MFIGRFTTALRVLVPGFSGMSGFSYPKFLTWNAAGGILRATGFVLLGYAAGSQYWVKAIPTPRPQRQPLRARTTRPHHHHRRN